MNVLSAALAGVALLAMVGGALLMTAGRLGVAGALFLSASITIYLRERWV